MVPEKSDKSINTPAFNRELDFDIFRAVLQKNYGWLLIIVLIGFLSAGLYLRYTKPIFESKAIIQRTLKDEGQRLLNFDNLDQENNLSADVELLKSPFLLEKVLMNLNLKVSYFSQGQVLTEEKFTQSPYHVTFLELKDSTLVNTPIFVNRIGEVVSIEYTNAGKTIRIPVKDNEVIDNDDFKLVFKIDSETKFLEDIESDQLYFKINNYKLLTQSLINNVNVSILNYDAKTIQVSFKSNNRYLAQQLVEELIETFFEYDLEKKSKSSENILKFIDEQLDTVYANLKYSEGDLQSFTNLSKNNNPELYKENLINQIDELRGQMLAADIESELINGLNQGVSSKDRASLYNLIPSLVGTRFQALLQGQLDKLYKLLEAKEDASYQFTDENEILRNLNTNIDAQVETIIQTLKSVKLQVSSRKEGLKKRLQILEGQLYGVPAKEMELAGLRRKFNLNEKYYSLLIEKRTEYQISKAGYIVDNNVLQSPTHPILTSPNKKLVYLSVFAISLLLCFLLIGIKYITFNVIHNENELRSLLPSKIGFLGSIPRVKMKADNSQLMVHIQPKSSLAENYRHIRSNLQFILDSERSNVISISSSISGEGKTFVSLNLAGIYTMSDKKVVILDLDLRKPKIHMGLKVENLEGMSSILSGRTKWQDCIHQSEDIENLSYITAGPIPPNPSELILNGVLDTVISELRNIFDIIIIDNPPVGIVSDGVNVMNNSDCPIYIVRANYTKRAVMQQVNKLVLENRLRELYVIFNDVEQNNSSYGYSYGGYYVEEESEKTRWWKIWK
ncbi:MAG: polysaccharide biosynthesis tyrosine autokinase [Putridiphycobacter sp.]|nr:polysaccharide biosynthesis tyrosine autokinase [Putridiphycobacter sp.]